jgi:uncharacterized protein (TIGR03000 family)
MVSADDVPLKVQLTGYFVIGKEVPGSYEGPPCLMASERNQHTPHLERLGNMGWSAQKTDAIFLRGVIMNKKWICALSLGLAFTPLILLLIVSRQPALGQAEGTTMQGPTYSVGIAEGNNLIATANRNNTLLFYTIDKGQDVGAPLKLRGSIDLAQVGKPVVKLTAPAGGSANATKANLTLVVPASAEVFFDDTPTTQTGTERVYVTPPLEVGKTFTYSVRVRWQENGKTVEQTRTVDVSAGGNVRVDFTRPRDQP